MGSFHLCTPKFEALHVIICFLFSDSFEIAAPSNRHIVSEPGKNVTLTCQPAGKWPVQQVTWEKIQPHQIDILTICNLSQGKSYASKYQREIWSSCSQDMRSTFIIMPHVTASDSGLYRCCFKASTGDSETFVMRLTVTDGEYNGEYEYVMDVFKCSKWIRPTTWVGFCCLFHDSGIQNSF